MYVRRYILLFLLCLIFFFLPLNVFIIGDYTGIGVQGALYKYQTSGYGTSFILMTRDVLFVLNNIYTGRTALSVILWTLGTILLACTLVYSFIQVEKPAHNFYRQVMYSLLVICGIYLTSCIAQYGFLFNGPAGISFPIGILTILAWTGIIYKFTNSDRN